MGQQEINIKNKRALHNYELIDKYIAGIQLYGTEIKSLRGGHASLVDSYCFFNRGELWVKGMRISEYFYGTFSNHSPERERKLLLQKKELVKLEKKVKESGYTIVPLRLFINDRGLAKLELYMARGKREYDKRETLKEKDTNRDLDRARKRF